MLVRSAFSSALATRQPSCSAPTRCSTGTRTSSKNSSANVGYPVIDRIGRMVMPGVRMSTSRKLMPACGFTSGSVRTRTKIQSARRPLLVQVLWPLRT